MPTLTTCTLKDIKPGQRAILEELLTESISYRHSLHAMGLIPGAIIRVIRYAPLGDPLQIEVNHCQLILRKQDAAQLLVSKLNETDHDPSD